MFTNESTQTMSDKTGSIVSIKEISIDAKLRKIYEEEEDDLIIMEFCKDLMNNVMDCIEAKMLTDQAHKLVVECAIEAIKNAVAVNYCHHNSSFSDLGKESWEPDHPCQPSSADSWAAYRVPVTYDREADVTIVEKEVDRESFGTKPSKGEFQEICTPHSVSVSPLNSSTDLLSIVEYLEDILSTSSDEELDSNSLLRLLATKKLSQRSCRFSAKLSAKLSQLSAKSSLSEHEIATPKLSDYESQMSSTFSKTTLGDTEKALRIPHVGNLPVSSVMIENPEVEEFTLVKVDKRKTRVTKRDIDKNLPPRRLETKLKFSACASDSTVDKSKGGKK